MTTDFSSDLAGRIRVRLNISGGQVTGVVIDNTRPEGVTKLFGGRTPEQTVLMLGMLFSLCSTAQSVAALRACEQALGLAASPSEQAARDILREAEMLTQTLMRVAMDWPKLLGLPPGVLTVKTALSAQSEVQQAIFGANDWKRLGGSGFTPNISALNATLRTVQDAMNADLFENGLVDKILAKLDGLGLNGFGALGEGQAPETGALSRNWDAPKVKDAREVHGAGLRARFLARLVDLEELPKMQMARVSELHPCDPDKSKPNPHGVGRAEVETARGALVHSAQISAGRVKAYEVDAPTDLNFEPGGVVEQGLKGADAIDGEALNLAANLHVLAVDPCVLCEVELGDDG